jgi:hypothetical protein
LAERRWAALRRVAARSNEHLGDDGYSPEAREGLSDEEEGLPAATAELTASFKGSLNKLNKNYS